jgi:hypothetical protein
MNRSGRKLKAVKVREERRRKDILGAWRRGR